MTNKPYRDSTHFHYLRPDYPVDVYINYARSMFLEVERQVIENPPRRPAEFWRLVDQARDRARARLRRVQTSISS